MTKQIRTKFQPTQVLEVSDSEHAALEHAALLFDGSDEELAAHYKAAALDLPPDLKPNAATGAAKSAEAAKTTVTTEQAKGA